MSELEHQTYQLFLGLLLGRLPLHMLHSDTPSWSSLQHDLRLCALAICGKPDCGN